MLQPQNDFSLAFLIGWVTDQLEMRDCLPRVVEDIANIFGALDFLWFAPKDVWTEGCIGDCISSWNCPVDNKLQCFSHPAATSIFVYRKASPGDFPVCSCADAEAVEERRLHIWLYAEENEGAKQKSGRSCTTRKPFCLSTSSSRGFFLESQLGRRC